MIFHPNPMVELQKGLWQDKHLSKLVVRPIVVNNSKNKTRWVVFKRTTRGSLVTLTRHITQEQAVVTAQTLANRLWKQAQRKDNPRSRKTNRNDRLTIISAERDRMTDFFNKAFDDALAGNPQSARRHANELVQFLERNF